MTARLAVAHLGERLAQIKEGVMGKTADPEEMLALRELTILNTHELAALIAVLERKGLLTHREVLDEIQRQRQEKT